jgi:hypothetical protein
MICPWSTDTLSACRRESVRLRGALKEIEMPIDIVVVRESTFQKLSDTPGLIYEEARRTGRLVYECESVSTKDQIVDLQVDDRMPNTEDPYEAVYN